jgi:hypothetical protein
MMKVKITIYLVRHGHAQFVVGEKLTLMICEHITRVTTAVRVSTTLGFCPSPLRKGK